MTPADDEYVDRYFVPLSSLPADPDWIRAEMLAGRLPLPSYLRSDGTEMVPADLLALAQRAGGTDHLAAWFAEQPWPAPEIAADAWEDYRSGQLVCLWSVTPENIMQKARMVAEIDQALASEASSDPSWLVGLHELVDELDALEPPFAPYDRLRFSGPTSRERYIDKIRAIYPLSRVACHYSD